MMKKEELYGVRLFVGLPLDAVSPDCNSVNHARAIAAGLKALKLLGVEGVELPIWRGIVEKESMGKYEWSGYLAIAEMVQMICPGMDLSDANQSWNGPVRCKPAK
ncbi:hypothetical protein K1719_005726 [Acacia pycnantha]|nr:hypothetical protein K1719_005726 [Acacia pycnantha]